MCIATDLTLLHNSTHSIVNHVSSQLAPTALCRATALSSAHIRVEEVSASVPKRLARSMTFYEN